ncbi:MAG: YggS family pyridoxal phosphate-dependent enzyme [Chloroflexota bacterium]|nr:YggS family pyridoxal phosphate-dependent enzyme [Chloroflexota bacterium]
MSHDIDPGLVDRIISNLNDIQSRIKRAADKSGRAAADVRLVGVTKLHPLETIQAGIQAGVRLFGENYPEQAVDKVQALQDVPNIQWHMIGHIQSRKAETVCRYFDMVHSLDRMKIARYLNRYCGKLDRKMPILLEVNLSGEESKYGWSASDDSKWSELVQPFRQIVQMPNLEIRGLMSMPPLFDDPEATRPFYQRLRRLQAFLREAVSNASWDELSIGTSFDYEVAIEEGATMVRIGTELFGPRPGTD